MFPDITFFCELAMESFFVFVVLDMHGTFKVHKSNTYEHTPNQCMHNLLYIYFPTKKQTLIVLYSLTLCAKVPHVVGPNVFHKIILKKVNLTIC
jgi:hypothetical protein